jgi:ABC-2 type transport system permease protein
MNKIKLVFLREYLSRVKKRSFLLTTFLVPLIVIGFYAAVIMISMDESNEEHKVAVIDKDHLLDEKKMNLSPNITFDFLNEETEASLVKKYLSMGYQSLLLINKDSGNTGHNKLLIHSPSALSMPVMNSIEKIISNNVRNQVLEAKGIDPSGIDKLTEGLKIENTIDNAQGENKGSAGIAYAVSYACGFLLYMMLIIYGTQVMRGVSEEKTNRISEVIVSSVKPFQLMLGKILGIGAVGLTQFILWIGLIYGLQFLIPLIFPAANQPMSGPGANLSMFGMVLQAISALPLSKILFMFLFYFLFGYLTYASIFAAVGSMVSDDQQEAQQMVFPIIMPIILGFVMMTKAVNEPNSGMAVFGSIFPLTSPVVMMGRMTYDIPYWHIAVSMLALIGTFLFFTWMSGKIFRIGVLMYGKKPSWKEIMKWAFRKG